MIVELPWTPDGQGTGTPPCVNPANVTTVQLLNNGTVEIEGLPKENVKWIVRVSFVGKSQGIQLSVESEETAKKIFEETVEALNSGLQG